MGTGTGMGMGMGHELVWAVVTTGGMLEQWRTRGWAAGCYSARGSTASCVEGRMRELLGRFCSPSACRKQPTATDGADRHEP